MLKKLLVIVAAISLACTGKSWQQPMITQTVIFTVEICSHAKTHFTVGLFGFDAPRTVENFTKICEGKITFDGIQLTYNNSFFHRIIPNFMLQAGDFTRGDGTGGLSIWGNRFADENFAIDHDIGVLSMANAGPNTNGSQFFITTAKASYLNGKHTVFGVITSGMSVVYAIEAQGSSSGQPRCPVRIVECSIMD